DSALQPRFQGGIGAHLARYSPGYCTDGYRRLSATLLDRAAGSVRDLRLHPGGRSGACARASRRTYSAGFGYDTEPEILRAQEYRPRSGADPARTPAGHAHGPGPVWRRGIDGDGEDRPRPE